MFRHGFARFPVQTDHMAHFGFSVLTALSVVSASPSLHPVSTQTTAVQAQKVCLTGANGDALSARIAACESWQVYDPAAPLPAYYKALLLNQAGEYGSAFDVFTHVLAMQGDLPMAWYHRGRIALEHRADPVTAIEDLSQAIILRGDDPIADARVFRGLAYVELARSGVTPDAHYAHARDDFRMVLERADPSLPVKNREALRSAIAWIDAKLS